MNTTATRSPFNDSPAKEAPGMHTPAKEITESYRYLRGECVAASELVEALAEFDILCVHLDGGNEIHVDLDATGLDRLSARTYRLQAAELLGLDYFDKATEEWRGMWNGVYVALRAYAPAARRSFRGLAAAHGAAQVTADRCAICGRRLRDDTRVARPSRADICTACHLHEEDAEGS